MKLKGSLTQIKARIGASGDTVQTVTLDVFGDFAALHDLMQKSLIITIEESDQ